MPLWPNSILTERLCLRPWHDDEADVQALFRWASDPAVGPAAGWPAHTSVQESRRIIREVLQMPQSYALCLRADAADVPLARAGAPVGAAALKMGAVAADALALPCTEAELGYWVARPLWGRGLMGEAARALLERGFRELGLAAIWGTHYERNARSARVMEKCGLAPVRRLPDVRDPLTGEPAPELVRRITRAAWEARQTGC